jgi:hypothetical protein
VGLRDRNILKNCRIDSQQKHSEKRLDSVFDSMIFDPIGLRSRCLSRKSNIFLAFAGKNKSLIVNLHKTGVCSSSRLPSIPPNASSSSNAPNVPVAAISSNFDRRIHVVCGCREFVISPVENGNVCDRQWMSMLDLRDQEKFFSGMRITFMGSI